ncbi:ankyrin, partial [Trichodelitschia bisporula]
MATTSLPLTEDDTSEILYCARAGEATDLAAYLAALAAQHGSTPGVVLLAATDPETGNTPLHYACANGHADLAAQLLSAPLCPSPEYVNTPNRAGNTPLHWAALNGHLPVVKVLLDHGADAGVLNAAGHDAVFEAEMNDRGEVVEFMLREVEELERAFGGGEGEG